MKKIISFGRLICRLGILLILINSMLFFISDMKMGLNGFINNVFKSIYIINENGENEFVFIKIITVLAIYLVVDMNLIYYVSHLSNGMNDILKYHSKNKLVYIKNLINVSHKIILESLLYWLYICLVCVFIFNRVAIYNEIDIFGLIGFIFLNYLFAVFVIIFGYNSLTVILLLVSKYFIFSLFLGKEEILICIIFILILGYFFNNRKVREILWKL